MGYGFSGYKNRKDFKNGDSIFYTSCPYAYQPIFKIVLGEEITNFSGYMSKNKIIKFKIGVELLDENRNKYEDKVGYMIGYIDNTSYEDLIKDFKELCNLLENKTVTYLNIA